MSFFVNPSETITVNFEDGPLVDQWIKIRPRLSGTEKKRITAARFSGVKTVRGGDGEDEAQVIEVDFTRDTARRLLAWLTAWSLVGDNGRIAPLNERTIGQLREDVVAQIEDAIDAREAEIADEAAAKLNPLPASSAAPTPTDDSPGESTSLTIVPPSYGDA